MISKQSYKETLDELWLNHITEKSENAPTVTSLFAGCGGSSLGYSAAGFRELLAVEWDDHAADMFKLNFPHVDLYHGDISKLSDAEFMERIALDPGELDVFDGSPPCQGFSMSGSRQVDDPRNSFFKEFIRLLRVSKPKVLIMENVAGMARGEMKSILFEILDEIKSSGYRVDVRIVVASRLGVPQKRERVIFIGIRNDLDAEIQYPKPEFHITSVSDAFVDCKEDIEKVWANNDKEKHKITPKDAWKSTKPGYSFSSVHPKGHWFNSIKINPMKPSPTIPKTCMLGWSGIYHWAESRLLTISEVKRVGSFPDQFTFTGKFQEQWARIGNSVPPMMMYKIAKCIREKILMK